MHALASAVFSFEVTVSSRNLKNRVCTHMGVAISVLGMPGSHLHVDYCSNSMNSRFHAIHPHAPPMLALLLVQRDGNGTTLEIMPNTMDRPGFPLSA